jgi:WD40 repeat protein
MIVTGGNDNKIKFWDPMGLKCLAVITEDNPIESILSFEKETLFYYNLSTKVMSFNYIRPKFETIFEAGKDNTVTKMIRSSDQH